MSESKIIGFEGGWSDIREVKITYGAAAIQRGNRVFNSVLEYGTPMEDWPEIMDAGHVGELAQPIDLPAELEGHPVYVLLSHADFCPVISESALAKGMETWAFADRENYVGFLFPSFEDLKLVANHAAEAIRTMIGDETGEEIDRWRSAARVLDPWDGLGQQEWIRQWKLRRDGTAQ